MTSETRVPMRNPELVWRPVGDELVIVRPSDGQIRVLNGVGALIWRSMDGHRAISQIAGLVCDEYEVSLEQAEDDIRLFLEPLTEDGMVQWSP
jgi:hypothetical protein